MNAVPLVVPSDSHLRKGEYVVVEWSVDDGTGDRVHKSEAGWLLFVDVDEVVITVDPDDDGSGVDGLGYRSRFIRSRWLSVHRFYRPRRL